MKIISVFKKFKFAAAGLIVVASLLMAVATPALAKTTDEHTVDYTRLSSDSLANSLTHDMTWAASLQKQINGASRDAIGTKLSRRADYKSMTQQQIVNMSGNVKLYRAQEYLAIAQGLINAHAGFDKNGAVTSRGIAENTLNNIDAALYKASFWLNLALNS